jgi:hypothetical protein
MAFFAISSFTITEKSTSELTKSPEKKWKTLFGVSCEREKLNQLTSNLISRWGETIILNSLAHNYYFPLPVLLKMF